jgi:hypothetical protein
MADPVPPRQDYQPPKQPTEEEQALRNYGSSSARAGGRSGGAAIAIGAIMLVAGIALSAAGTGRIFIGLIVVGIINIVRGLAA